MYRLSFWIGLMIFLSPNFASSQTNIEIALFELEDVIFSKISTADGYQSSYRLMIRQPLDHDNPDAGYFYQKVYLSHKSFDVPTVLVTEGYQRSQQVIYEFSDYMQANQIQVEHRFYGESVPENADYTYLNLEQATNDLHRIREMFAKIYKGSWLTTGISKGGMTTLFYKYFYPDDVDVSVPYVAPINLELKDPRIYDFLDSVGSEECRTSIYEFQKELLERKDEILPLLKWYGKGAGLEFNELGLEKVFELSVLEYSFAFWQFGISCSLIPEPEVVTDSLISHLLSVSGIDFFSDATLNGFSSFYYQMGTEMGYYGYETEEFGALIEETGEEPSAVFLPEPYTDKPFDGSLTRKVDKYLREKAERVLYINGGIDTWSATGIIPSDHVDAVLINMPGKHHRSARIINMTKEQQRTVKENLERWLGQGIPAYLPAQP